MPGITAQCNLSLTGVCILAGNISAPLIANLAA